MLDRDRRTRGRKGASALATRWASVMPPLAVRVVND
jgi:hypothetical protein